MILRNGLLSLTAIALTALPQLAPAAIVELALVIDGSGSISGPNGNNQTTPPDYGDFGLQLDGYRNVFEGDFYTNVIAPSPFDTLVVAAYVFSGGASFTITMGNDVTTIEFPVYSFLDWTEINSDADAAAFGAQFDPSVIPQPGGSTNTSAALDIALNGGAVGCPDATACFPRCTPAAAIPESRRRIVDQRLRRRKADHRYLDRWRAHGTDRRRNAEHHR